MHCKRLCFEASALSLGATQKQVSLQSYRKIITCLSKSFSLGTGSLPLLEEQVECSAGGNRTLNLS